MSTQRTQSTFPTFTTNQYAFYMLVGAILWTSGVIIVRVIGSAFFTAGNPLLLLLFAGSIPFGMLLQTIVPLIIKLPLKDTLIPVIVMSFVALLLDGVVIGFTNIYSSDIGSKVMVGSWLLWTFGVQLLVSLVMIVRANRS